MPNSDLIRDYFGVIENQLSKSTYKEKNIFFITWVTPASTSW